MCFYFFLGRMLNKCLERVSYSRNVTDFPEGDSRRPPAFCCQQFGTGSFRRVGDQFSTWASLGSSWGAGLESFCGLLERPRDFSGAQEKQLN